MNRIDKNIGEHVTGIKEVHFQSWKGKQNSFLANRKHFIESLEKEGYTTYTNGNYITATRRDEVNTFFFISHSDTVSNYLIPMTLRYRVQYFAFYDEKKKCIYNVSYGKVREYCQGITKAVRFAGCEPKMFIPDSWAKDQVFNTRNIK